MDDQLIAKSVYDHLNAWPEKPCQIRLELMDKAPIAFTMSMQQLSGTRVLRRYIDGSFKGAWPFAVYVRMSASDTAKKFNAVSILETLNQWLMSADLPQLGTGRTASGFEMTALPAIAATYEDGSVDYQAVFQLEYKQRSDFNA